MLRTPIAIVLLMFASASFGAGDADNGYKLFIEIPKDAQGQNLYDKPSCFNCHGTSKYTSPDRVIKNYNELETQVRFCDSKVNTNWFDTDIHDVVAYLNKQYYKFPVPDTQ